MSLPHRFVERLQKILPDEKFQSFLPHFSREKHLSLRINTLKVTREDAMEYLKAQGISYSEVGWCKEALVLKEISKRTFREDPWVGEGKLYIQNLSSMLPVLVLDPKPGEQVLDMCAAPGSKTTQIAAQMKNEGRIVALDAIRGRYFKLKSNCERLGTRIADIKCLDARRFKMKESFFDKVLVDAPCSSEGGFNVNSPKSYAYWSERKIKEMSRKQKGLLLNATRLLKPGGTLVYSTCTFAPEENEACVDWLLRKLEGRISVQAIDLKYIPMYPTLTKWKKKVYNPEVRNCLRIVPDERWIGFFIAKFVLQLPPIFHSTFP